MNRLLKTAAVLFAAGLATSGFAAGTRPGTVNYIEGSVTVDNSPADPHTIFEIAPGKTLQTGAGKAEILLTPGVFFRVGDHSSVRMLADGLTNTKVEVLSGTALLEVAQIEKKNHLVILNGDAEVQISEKGLYEFQASPAHISVYNGKAEVRDDGHSANVTKGEQLALDTGRLKSKKFDRDQTNDLYDWSEQRSSFLAGASEDSAQALIILNADAYSGANWYWNPWLTTWAFIPGPDLLWSPFGYGFYSPSYSGYRQPVFHRHGYGGYPRGTWPHAGEASRTTGSADPGK
jgi:hypothetical protein